MKYFDFGDGRGLVPAIEHRNGGGLVALTAHVDPTVYVGKECWVFGFAWVTGRVKITGRARISGQNVAGGISTLIEDDVAVCGDVVIEGCVLLRDHARISGSAHLKGSIQVAHRAMVGGSAVLEGDVQLLDAAYIHGQAVILGHTDHIVIRGDRSIGGTTRIERELDLVLPPKKHKRRRSDSSDELPVQVVKIAPAISGCSGLTQASASVPGVSHVFGVPFMVEPMPVAA